MEPKLIGIAGGTGSGKTTLAEQLATAIGKDKILLFSTDHYYHDLTHLTEYERSKNNFDHPNAIDWPLFRQHVSELLQNRSIDAPVYSFKSHTREGTQRIDPKPLIVIEGIFRLYDKEICNIMKLKIFVDTPHDIRLIRRLKRDISERGRNVESVLEQWEQTVSPSHSLFIEPTKYNAHVIIPECPDGTKREVASRILLTVLREYHLL